RVEPYQLEDERLRQAARAVGALVRRDQLVADDDGNLEFPIPETTYGEGYQLCPGVRFMDQPLAANCSGFLVTDELFVTAGHCVDDILCSELSIAFDLAYTADGLPDKLGAEQVYHCAEFVENIWDGPTDFALIKLDRPVEDREPLQVADEVEPGASAMTLGFPNRIPMKVAATTVQDSPFAPGWRVARAELLENGFYTEDELLGFEADAQASFGNLIAMDGDVFGGNSGGALIDASTGAAMGVVIWGSRKYRDGEFGGKDMSFAWDDVATCRRPTVCGDDVDCITYPAAVRLSDWSHLWQPKPWTPKGQPVFEPTRPSAILDR
ncbi:MAG: serine protease, partial [Deltaproteobacteria bacterium]|nr:serine protease [Deltaproteobacteria bacterium]